MKQIIHINENTINTIVERIIREFEEMGLEEGDFIGDELETINDALSSIERKLQRNNLTGADEQSLGFVSSRVQEIRTALNQLLSDDWY